MPRAYTPAELAALCRDMHPTLDMRARGALLCATNDEPEPDEAALIAADRQYSIGRAERFHRLNDRRALEIQVREQDCGVRL